MKHFFGALLYCLKVRLQVHDSGCVDLALRQDSLLLHILPVEVRTVRA